MELYKPPKVHFCTFGNLPNYARALETITKEAEASGYFDTVNVYTQDTITLTDTEREFISKNNRGYGYWIWKPNVIESMMNRYLEGDIVIFVDAGSGISVTPEARIHMKKWIEDCITHPTHRVAFQIGFPEEDWTKSDIFEYFGVLGNSKITKSGQIPSGFQIYMITPNNKEFIRKYREAIAYNNYRNITDEPSILPNAPTFRENRHDQSFLSVMLKIYGAQIHGYNGTNPASPVMSLRRRYG
jgi:hypothetical protein